MRTWMTFGAAALAATLSGGLTGCGEGDSTLPPTERVQDVDDAPNPEVNQTPAEQRMEQNAVPADSAPDAPDAGTQG